MRPISVVVATCNRPQELAACLDSLLAQTHPADRILVVDDAPGGDLTPAVVRRFGPDARVQYVKGGRAGLADAHNRGLSHVQTELVAFTDDDVIADPDWLAHITAGFDLTDRVGCVTGLIEPLELKTDAQRMLDDYAGFSKGDQRRIFDLGDHRPDDPLFPFAAGQLGSGANMAFSRSALAEMGGFDPALGAGTKAQGGDDLSAFFEVIQLGYRLVYEPAALVKHRHSPDFSVLERQVHGYGVGLTAYLTKSIIGNPRLIPQVIRQMPAAVAHITSPDSAKNQRLPALYPRNLVRRERIGMVKGPFAYLASRRASSRGDA